MLEVSPPDPVFLAVVSTLGVIATVTAALLLHLCLFHCYISILGITTYEYIRNYRMGKPNPCPEIREACCRWQSSSRDVGRTLKRPHTDPEFLDRGVKPFVVPIPEHQQNPSSAAEPTFSLSEWIKLCPKQLAPDISTRASSGKVKCNQVRPTTEDELNRALDKIAQETPVLLPVLPVQTPQTAAQLQQFRSVLDLAECGRGGRRLFKPHPHTPSLSPIRESGLSNQNSPRLPPVTPPLSRPASPQVSTIFLSNPVSPCSSDEEEQEEEVVSPVTFRCSKPPEDILQTPQMPRKTYSPKQVFVVRSTKLAVPRRTDQRRDVQ